MAHQLTAQKARLMLHEGIANKHPITDKQRRFFGWVSGGRKDYGGQLPTVILAMGGPIGFVKPNSELDENSYDRNMKHPPMPTMNAYGGKRYFLGGVNQLGYTSGLLNQDTPLMQGYEPQKFNPSGQVINNKSNPLLGVSSQSIQDVTSGKSANPIEQSAKDMGARSNGFDFSKSAGLLGLAGGLVGQNARPSNKFAGTASGMLSGAAAGALLGPIGMGVGALVGGASGLIGSSQAKKAEDMVREEEARQRYASNVGNVGNIYELGGDIMRRYKYSPVNVNPDGKYYALGGIKPRLTEFNTGGSHESNPIGGIPQGTTSDGTPNLVEQGETKFNNYIFSDRLKLKNPSEYNLGGRLTGKSFAEISKKISKQAEERPNDPISRRGQEKLLNRLKEANDDAIEEKNFEEESEEMNIGGMTGQSEFRYGGFIFKDLI